MDKAKRQIIDYALEQGLITNQEEERIQELIDNGLLDRLVVDYCSPEGIMLIVELKRLTFTKPLIPEIKELKKWVGVKEKTPPEGWYWCNISTDSIHNGEKYNSQMPVFFDNNGEWIDPDKEWGGPVNVTHYTELMPEPNF